MPKKPAKAPAKEPETKTTTKGKTKTETQVGLDAQTFRTVALEAVQNIDHAYLGLAEAVFVIKHGEHYRTYGFKNFQEYCEKELDLEYSRASALTNIWDKIKGLDLPKDRLEKLGFSKARLLVRHINDDNFQEMLEMAEKNTVMAMREKLSKTKTGGDAPPSNALILKFPAGSPQATAINDALEIAKKEYGTDDVIVAAAALATDWVARVGKSFGLAPAEDILKVLNRSYPGTFVYAADEGEEVEEVPAEETAPEKPKRGRKPKAKVEPEPEDEDDPEEEETEETEEEDPDEDEDDEDDEDDDDDDDDDTEEEDDDEEEEVEEPVKPAAKPRGRKPAAAKAPAKPRGKAKVEETFEMDNEVDAALAGE